MHCCTTICLPARLPSRPPRQVDFEAVGACSDARDCTIPMGITSENVAARYGVPRCDQDAFAAASHARAHAAQQAGK
jgi:acetyl-CoA acetyltransferase